MMDQHFLRIDLDCTDKLVKMTDIEIQEYNIMIERDCKFLMKNGLSEFELFLVIENHVKEKRNTLWQESSND